MQRRDRVAVGEDAAVTPDDLRIAPETPADQAGVHDVVRRAFAHHPAVADLVDLIRASPQFVPGLSLVARRGSAVVGHVMLSHTDLVDDDGVRREVLTLSPLAVEPEHQGQGIGSALVVEGLRRAAVTDEPLVTLEGSPRYYPRLGFDPSTEHGIRIDLPDWAPPEASMVYLLPAYDPAFRGRVEYPPAFAAVAAD